MLQAFNFFLLMGKPCPISCRHPADIFCAYHHKPWAALIKRSGEQASGEQHDKSPWKDKLTWSFVYLQEISLRFIEFLLENCIVLEWALSCGSHALLPISIMELQNFLGNIWSLSMRQTPLGLLGWKRKMLKKR